MAHRRALAALLLSSVVVAACRPAADAPDPPNGAVNVELRVDHPMRLVDGVVAITRNYLAAMRNEIAAPDLHVVARVQEVWALPANEAWTVDPCIPKRSEGFIVWVTRGVGDYLNLRDLAWSSHFGQFDEGVALACRGAASSGTVVIDDLTGQILGVFPGDHRDLAPVAS